MYSFFGTGAELPGTPGNTRSRAPHELPQVFLLCGCPSESDQGHLCSLMIGIIHWFLVGSPLCTKLKTMVLPLTEPIISNRSEVRGGGALIPSSMHDWPLKPNSCRPSVNTCGCCEFWITLVRSCREARVWLSFSLPFGSCLLSALIPQCSLDPQDNGGSNLFRAEHSLIP